MIEKAGKEEAHVICLAKNSNYFFSNLKNYL